MITSNIERQRGTAAGGRCLEGRLEKRQEVQRESQQEQPQESQQ